MRVCAILLEETGMTRMQHLSGLMLRLEVDPAEKGEYIEKIKPPVDEEE